MITKQKKTEIVAELVEKLKKASGYYLVDFQGMTVEASIRCRREMKKKNVDFKVVKNTLLKRAIDEVGGIEFPDDLYCGSTAVVLGYDDPTIPAKVIKEQFDKFEKPKLKAAYFDGQYFDNTQLKQCRAGYFSPSTTVQLLSEKNFIAQNISYHVGGGALPPTTGWRSNGGVD